MKLTVIRIWCLVLGLGWLYASIVSYLFLHGERSFFWYVLYVFAPGGTGLTLVLFVLRGVTLPALTKHNDDAETIRHRRRHS